VVLSFPQDEHWTVEAASAALGALLGSPSSSPPRVVHVAADDLHGCLEDVQMIATAVGVSSAVFGDPIFFFSSFLLGVRLFLFPLRNSLLQWSFCYSANVLHLIHFISRPSMFLY
jgi:hypothetical protein